MRYNDFVATAGYLVELLSLPSVLVLDGSRLLVCSSLLKTNLQVVTQESV